MSKKRRQHSPDLKARVGLEALKGIEPIHAIPAKYEVHPVQVCSRLASTSHPESCCLFAIRRDRGCLPDELRQLPHSGHCSNEAVGNNLFLE